MKDSKNKNLIFSPRAALWIQKDILLFMSKSGLPVFPCKSFIISGLKFRSSIHFHFIFMYVLESVLISLFYM